jgi:hypothetical protein
VTGLSNHRLFSERIGNNRLRRLRHWSRVTEADAAAIREAYETGGELSAAVELRRRFPGIIDNAPAREQAHRIAAWTPLPDRQHGAGGAKLMPIRGSLTLADVAPGLTH